VIINWLFDNLPLYVTNDYYSKILITKLEIDFFILILITYAVRIKNFKKLTYPTIILKKNNNWQTLVWI
jgi:hypothetical protein